MDKEIFFITLDIGGTKTGLGIFKPGFGLLTTNCIPTQPGSGCEALIKRAYKHSLELLEQCGLSYGQVAGVGVVSPGPLNLAAGTIVHAPTLGWRGTPLMKTAEKVFERPVALQGDTAGAALGEYTYGCGGVKPKSLIYITVSTGVGCGIVIGGGIYNGAFDAAGELGHLKVVADGAECPCGGRGCLESIVSGTGIARLALERTGQARLAKEVFALARSGDTVYAQIVEQAGNALGIGIAALMQLFDPEIIILGGSVSNDFEQLKPHIVTVLSVQVQNYYQRKTAIRKTNLPNGHNALLGAGEWSLMHS